MLLKSSVSLLIFCLLVLASVGSGMLKSPPVTVENLYLFLFSVVSVFAL